MEMQDLLNGRCGWCGTDSLYVKYHDEEWGVPNHNDRDLFELLILEGFQAGLSWITVLKKREAFRKAFDNFDVKKVSEYDEEKTASIIDYISNAEKVTNEVEIPYTYKDGIYSAEYDTEQFVNAIWLLLIRS